MGLLAGLASVSRLNVVACPELPDFDRVPFRAITAGSEVRETVGFVPFEPEAPYQIGHTRHAFRVRVDRRRPDPTTVRERVKELVAAEVAATGATAVGPRKRKRLRELAEEELLATAQPRTRIVEGVLDGGLVYVDTTSRAALATVTLLLRQIGVLVEPKAPWLDLGEAEVASELVETSDAGESVLGCWFLKDLVGDRDVLVEPENGLVRLQTREARVTLAGGVLPDLHRFLERGAEMLSARLTVAGSSFRLDALPFWVSGLKVETGRHDHWTLALDERLEKIAALYELLEEKYRRFRQRATAVG
jgi:hypothetical protein